MAKHDKINSDNLNPRIQVIRDSIDTIDNKILELINERLSYAKEIAEIKKKAGSQILDKKRENIIVERLVSLNKGQLNNNVLMQIFKEIFAASREIQKPQTVTYLGPEYTFSHIAAMNYFGRSVSFIPQPDIFEIFCEVEKQNFNYGIVPVENSIGGAVNRTLDLLFESDLKICAETYHLISHDLLSNSDSLDKIKVVYSHPQPIAQCRNWLRNNLPGIETIECSSTSMAAKKASEKNNSAAISSTEAASFYNLKILSSKIEDFAQNTTRFLIIGNNDEICRTGNDKTSIMFVTAHAPGALCNVLEPIAAANLNMVKLESRPIKRENWSYFFTADIDGHIQDDNLKETIANMKQRCLFLKCLGSYPKVN